MSHESSPVAVAGANLYPLGVAGTAPTVWATAGMLTAPAANDILADTGPLAAGDYEIFVALGTTESSTKAVKIQHRDAANSSSIKEHAFPAALYHTPQLYIPRLTLAANERVRAIHHNGASAGQFYSVSIFYRRVA